jgi:glycosyltransferase involved in cell wall biosynthesis
MGAVKRDFSGTGSPRDAQATRRVCLVAYDALPVVDASEAGAFGGRETRAWRIAQHLAAQPDWEVRMVVRHHRPARRREQAGVRIVTRVDRWFRLRRFVSEHVDVRHSRPWLRIRRWHWGLPAAILCLAAARPWKPETPAPTQADPFFQAQDAHVYLCFGVNAVSASVISTARAMNRPSVLFLASDADLAERFAQGADSVNEYGERGDVGHHVLAAADHIVAQTPRQRRLLQSRFQRDARVIGNPIDLDLWRPAESLRPGAEVRHALWVGRADRFHKRPLLLLSVAEKCPDVQFLMVMNPGDAEAADEVRRRCPPNVRIVNRVPFVQMPELFRNAFVFISTGSAEHEGFPNTFLQAAASGAPIASCEADPGFVASQACGFVSAADLDELAAFVRRLHADPALGRDMGRRGREYVCRNHDLNIIGEQLVQLIREVY